MPDFSNIKEYEGRYVNVTFKDGDVEMSLDGTVVRAEEMVGLALRPKSRRIVLIETQDLLTVTQMTEPGKMPRIKVRYLDPVDEDSVRQHLADRHGYLVAGATHPNLDALKEHSEIDHSVLGHRHEAKPTRAHISQEAAAERAAVLDELDITEEDDETQEG